MRGSSPSSCSRECGFPRVSKPSTAVSTMVSDGVSGCNNFSEGAGARSLPRSSTLSLSFFSYAGDRRLGAFQHDLSGALEKCGDIEFRGVVVGLGSSDFGGGLRYFIRLGSEWNRWVLDVGGGWSGRLDGFVFRDSFRELVSGPVRVLSGGDDHHGGGTIT